MNKNLLIVFAKNPEFGKVKTRLAKEIGEEKALAVYLKLLNNIRKVIQPVRADKAIFYNQYIDTEDDFIGYKKALQEGKTLGEKMFNALQTGKSWGYDKVGLIGSDIYGLNDRILNNAFELLSEKDYVFGPAKDGGYYFIGCKNPKKEIFDLREWSHKDVLEETLGIAEKNEISVALTEMLNDIDTWEDLKDTKLGELL